MCAESSTSQPLFRGAPCWALHTEHGQRRLKPRVRLSKPHSCPRDGRRSSARLRSGMSGSGGRPLNSRADWGMCGRRGRGEVRGEARPVQRQSSTSPSQRGPQQGQHGDGQSGRDGASCSGAGAQTLASHGHSLGPSCGLPDGGDPAEDTEEVGI